MVAGRVGTRPVVLKSRGWSLPVWGFQDNGLARLAFRSNMLFLLALSGAGLAEMFPPVNWKGVAEE